MALIKFFEKITFTGILLATIVAIVGVQLFFLVAGFFFPSLAGIKLGYLFYFLLAAFAAYFFLKLVIRIDKFQRRDALLILFVMAFIGAFFWATQTYLPQVFSIAAPQQFQSSLSHITAPTSFQSIFTG